MKSIKKFMKKLSSKYHKLMKQWEFFWMNEDRINFWEKVKIISFKLMLVVISSFGLLLILRLFGYDLSYINYYSAVALYFYINEIPSFIKRCRK